MSPDVFPTKNGIPREVLPALPIHQRETLVNGELRPWTGRVETVRPRFACVNRTALSTNLNSAVTRRAVFRKRNRRSMPQSRHMTTAAASGRP